MKILIVSSAAKRGSIGSILTILRRGYEINGHTVKICYGHYKDRINDDVYYPICTQYEFRKAALFTRLFGKEGFYSKKSTLRLIKEIELFKPDIVHITNIHAYYINEYDVLNYLKERHIPTVYSLFDAYSFTGKCPFPLNCSKYQDGCGKCPQKREYPKSLFFDKSSFLYNEKKKAYSNFDSLVFVGGIGIIDQARESTLLKNQRILLVDEPQDLDKVYYPRDTSKLREKLGIPVGNKVVLAAVPLAAGTDRKAGFLFLELYEKMKNIDGYTFIYIGFNTKKYGDPEGMIKVPYLNSQDDFATYLSLGDVLFFTSTADTTPCTVIDALACGTPVIGFDIDGINCFKIQDKNIMNVAPIGDVDYVKKIVEGLPCKNEDIITRCRESVYSRFNSAGIVNKYLELYNLMNNKYGK